MNAPAKIEPLDTPEIKPLKGCGLAYFHFAAAADKAAQDKAKAKLIGMKGVHKIQPANPGHMHDTPAGRWQYAHVESGLMAPTLDAMRAMPQIAQAHQLFNMLSITVDTSQRAEHAVRRKAVRDLARLGGISSVEAVSHMEAMDNPGEVSFRAYVPPEGDVDAVVTSIAAFPSVRRVAVAGLVHT